MKIFTKKNILQKIIIAIVIVILFNFIAPNISRAEDFGGVLFTPIQSLVLGLGDGLMYIISATLNGDLSTDNVITLSTDATLNGIVKIALSVALPQLGAILQVLQTGDYVRIMGCTICDNA